MFANGRQVVRPSELLSDDAALEATPAHPWVGRGALKLVHALALWPIEVSGRVVLDVGASTGGFTEVCLARGAARVFAVDVGQGQLHASLRADGRVLNLEATDARNLTRELITEPPGLIVSDVSFIGLAKALPAALALASPGADLVALVKPQFEVGPDKVGKRGIVTAASAREHALAAVAGFLSSSSWNVRATTDSPITGGDGNREYLLWATRERS